MLRNKICIFILVFAGLLSLCLAQESFVYRAKGKRNPFIPLVGKDGRLMKLDKEESKEAGGLSIDGIIFDKGGVSYALVGGKVVATGDYVGEYRVLKIGNDKVSFLKDDEIKEVYINKDKEGKN